MARQSSCVFKERVRYIFKWLDSSVARQSFSRIKERVRYTVYLSGSTARWLVSRFHCQAAEPAE